MGGAFVALPILTSSFIGLSQNAAHGTSMAVVLATAFGGVLAYASHPQIQHERHELHPSDMTESSRSKIGDVDIETAVAIALSASVFAIAGAKTSKNLSAKYLKTAVGIFMIAASPTPLIREYLADYKEWTKAVEPKPTEDNVNVTWSQRRIARVLNSLVMGSFAGFLAGVFGVGGGALVVPGLCLFSDLEYKEALGTSLAAMLPTAVTGSITHLMQGTMNVRVAIPLAIGSVSGAYLSGQYIAQRVDQETLKFGFTSMMVLLGSRTLYQGLRMVR